jgi:hypothetical protein
MAYTLASDLTRVCVSLFSGLACETYCIEAKIINRFSLVQKSEEEKKKYLF